MLKDFINAVSRAVKRKEKAVTIPTQTAKHALDFITQVLDARKKGGQHRHKNTELSQDPAAIRNREAVRRHRAKKQKEEPKQ